MLRGDGCSAKAWVMVTGGQRAVRCLVGAGCGRGWILVWALARFGLVQATVLDLHAVALSGMVPVSLYWLYF